MDWQYLLTLAMIALAGSAVMWHFAKVIYSAWTGKGCGSGCGTCHSTPATAETAKVGLPLIRND